MFPVAILAGGLATRLRPITETVPKSLVEVAGKPFIIHQLDYLREQGLSRVVLCVGYLGDMIADVVNSHNDLGLEISYSADGPDLLGTGGALLKAIPKLDDQFFVLYGDSFLPVNFSEIQEAFSRSKKDALMTILKNYNQWDGSNVSFVNGRILEYDKKLPKPDMFYIDYGLSVISPSVLKEYSDLKSFDLSDVFKDLSLKGLLAGFEVNERFYEIGSHVGLKQTQEFFSKKENI